MYRPKKYIRLNQLPRMPRLADVKNLHEEGKKARSCTVELPWRTEKLGMTFSLTVRVDVGGSEPVWTLYEGEGNRSRVMWSTGFADVDLLYDVLTLSLPADGPNIFAPQPEAPKPAKPAVKVEAEPSYYDKEQFRGQASSSPSYDSGSSFSSPFLGDEDQFLKPEPSTFESYSSKDKGKDKDKDKNKNEFALPAVPEKAADKAADEFVEKAEDKSADKSSDLLVEKPAPKVDRPSPPTSDFVNPLAEPQISLGAQRQGAPSSYPDPQQQFPGNQSMATGGYPQQQQPGYPQGYPPQPGYPPQYPPQQEYPPQQGYPPPQGYPPQPGYPGASGQYPAGGYPPQPGYPGGSGQYPATPYPPYPPYGQPGQGPPMDPMAPAGTVPLGPGMPSAGYDPYGGMPMAPGMAHKRPAIMLGTFLVEAGLVPKSTIDSALQVQVLVSQGTLSPVKAAEAVRRAHLRGGGLEPEENAAAFKPNDSAVRIKPQIGQVLVMAGIITAVQLKAALYLQDVMRSGSMSMEDAVELLKREVNTAQVKTQTEEQIKAAPSEDFTKAIALTKQAGLVSDSDIEAAHKVKAKHGGEISKILVVAGKLDQLTLDGARTCQKYIDDGKIRTDQAIMALHYCQRMRVPFEEAANELGLDI
jgi:hypothetical protein